MNKEGRNEKGIDDRRNEEREDRKGRKEGRNWFPLDSEMMNTDSATDLCKTFVFKTISELFCSSLSLYCT